MTAVCPDKPEQIGDLNFKQPRCLSEFDKINFPPAIRAKSRICYAFFANNLDSFDFKNNCFCFSLQHILASKYPRRFEILPDKTKENRVLVAAPGGFQKARRAIRRWNFP